MADGSHLLQSSIQAYLEGRADVARAGLKEALRCDPSNVRARSFLILLESLKRSSAAFEDAPQLPLADPAVDVVDADPATTREGPIEAGPSQRLRLSVARLARRTWSSISDWAATSDLRGRGRRSLVWGARAAPQLVLALALIAGGWAALRNRALIAQEAARWTDAARAWVSPSRAGPVPRPIPSRQDSARPDASSSAPAPPPRSAPPPRARVVIELPPGSRPVPRHITSANRARGPAPPGVAPARGAAPEVRPAASASPEVTAPSKPWTPPRWGIGVDEVVRSFPPGTVRVSLDPTPSDGGLTARASAERIRLASGTYSASCLFDSVGALSAVELRPSQQRRSAESVFDELSSWLSTEYGRPIDEGELPGGGPTVRRLTWNTADTRVTLEARRSGDVRGAHILLLDVASGSVRPADANAVLLTYRRSPP
jgi:hypothetical protein